MNLNKIFLFFVFFIFLIVTFKSALAIEYSPNGLINITTDIVHNDTSLIPVSTAQCNLSILNSTDNYIIQEQMMTNKTGGLYEYQLDASTVPLDKYYWYVRCVNNDEIPGWLSGEFFIGIVSSSTSSSSTGKYNIGSSSAPICKEGEQEVIINDLIKCIPCEGRVIVNNGVPTCLICEDGYELIDNRCVIKDNKTPNEIFKILENIKNELGMFFWVLIIGVIVLIIYYNKNKEKNE